MFNNSICIKDVDECICNVERHGNQIIQNISMYDRFTLKNILYVYSESM